MGRYLSYVLLDKDGEEIEFEDRYELYQLGNSDHIGNVYSLIEFYDRGSSVEHSFTLEEIHHFVEEKSKQYTLTQLISGSKKCDDLFTELHLLSSVYENAISLIKERNLNVFYVHFKYY